MRLAPSRVAGVESVGDSTGVRFVLVGAAVPLGAVGDVEDALGVFVVWVVPVLLVLASAPGEVDKTSGAEGIGE